MLHLLHDKDLPEAFNVPDNERQELIRLVNQIIENDAAKKGKTLTWTMERVWIDERFSDNLKAMALFMLGYCYAVSERRNYGGNSISGPET